MEMFDPDPLQGQGYEEQGGIRDQDGSLIQSVYIDKDALNHSQGEMCISPDRTVGGHPFGTLKVI